MNRRFVVIATGAAGLTAFAAAGLWYRRSFPTTDGPAALQESSTLVRPEAPVLGPPDAPVTIVEFFDPSCEACRAFHPLLKRIMDVFPGKVRVVIRYTPFHEGSEEAVRILETARLQGLYIPVLEALLARQPEWAVHGAPNLQMAWSIAGTAGLDLDRARRDMNAPSITRIIEQDVADVRRHDVRQTPTFFVNGRALPSFGAQQLIELVRSEVERLPAS